MRWLPVFPGFAGTRCPRGSRHAFPVLVLGLALAALAAKPAPAYVAIRSGRWDPMAWPPGTTMSVVLVDSPLWYGDADGEFRNIAEVRQVVQEALDVWANIPTADIRWRVDQVISEAEWEARFGRLGTERGGTITIRRGSGRGGGSGADVRHSVEGRRGEDPNLIYGCHVMLATRYAPAAVFNAAHEFGHCLGLGHAELFVLEELRWQRDIPGFPSYWRYDPFMSYGSGKPSAVPLEDHLTADDRIGASVLRPAPGFLEATGSIVGRVTLPDGTPAVAAYVLATRLLEPEDRSYSVGVMADPWTADFEIAGLPPGDYQLLVRSLTGKGNGWIIRRIVPGGFPEGTGLQPEVVRDLRQTLRAAPVRVRAGAVSGPVPLAVRPRGEVFP